MRVVVLPHEIKGTAKWTRRVVCMCYIGDGVAESWHEE